MPLFQVALLASAVSFLLLSRFDVNSLLYE